MDKKKIIIALLITLLFLIGIEIMTRLMRQKAKEIKESKEAFSPKKRIDRK